MKKLFIHSILIFTNLCIGTQRTQANMGELGYFTTRHIDHFIILKSSEPIADPASSAQIIEKYIHLINPDREQKSPQDLSTTVLARRIAGLSHCMKIDPFIFTALIHKESAFHQRAKSETNAAGFTQFTSIAMKEVNDQLGMRGNGYAKTEAIQYFNDILTDDCLEKYGEFKSTGKNYVPLWETYPANSLKKNSITQTNKMVSMLLTHPEYALIYGAILFKVKYSYVASGFKTGCYPSKPKNLREKIRETLMFYNGDGCTIQKKYQSDILGRFYSKMTSLKAE